jgi:hypothetical protein
MKRGSAIFLEPGVICVKLKKMFSMLFLTILGPFGHPQMDPKRDPKAPKWVEWMTQCQYASK